MVQRKPQALGVLESKAQLGPSLPMGPHASHRSLSFFFCKRQMTSAPGRVAAKDQKHMG